MKSPGEPGGYVAVQCGEISNKKGMQRGTQVLAMLGVCPGRHLGWMSPHGSGPPPRRSGKGLEGEGRT